MGCLYAIAKADFLQRIRSYGFLITLGICLVSALGIIPPAGATYSGVLFGQSRGLNTCAWIGMAATIVFTIYIFLAGFYLINNTVKRDEETGVGQIIASTPVTSFDYLTGKMLSNAAVLFSMLGVLALAGLLIFLIRGEGGGFQPGRMLMPMLLILPPGLILLSGIAVFVETIPRLPRGFVNIAWFFVWTTVLSLSMISMEKLRVATAPTQIADATGVWTVMNRVESEIEVKDPAYKRGTINIAFPLTQDTQTTFRFDGNLPYGLTWIARWVWLPAALLLLGLASCWFRRFDSTRTSRRERKEGRRPLRVPSPGDLPGSGPGLPAFQTLPAPESRFSLVLILKSELRLMLLGRPWWWLAVTAGLFVATIFTPLAIAHGILLPVLWFWLIRLYSGIGSRESTYRTFEYLFAAPQPLARQLPAALGAVVLLHLTLALPLLIRNLAAGNLHGIAGIFAGALFLPSLAMALGAWTGGSKLFEVVYTILWYVLLNKGPAADYLGGLEGAASPGQPLIYLSLACLCTLLAIQGRRRRIFSRG